MGLAVAPRDPVVPVAELVQADVVAVRGERLLECLVRREILLDRPAAEHDRDRAHGPVAVDAADETRDPLVTREVPLVRLRAAEKASGLEKQRVEGVRIASVSMEEGEGAEARAEADANGRGRECGQDLVGERAGVAGARGVRLVSVDGADQGGAERRQPREKRHEGGVLGVLRPVVGDEHRTALGRLGMRPDEGGELGLQDAARDRDGLGLAARFGFEPGRRLIAGLLPHRLVAPWPARRLRVVGIEHPLAAAAAVDQLELVLEACDVRCGRGQLPAGAVPRELVRQPLAQLVCEADGGEATAWIGELEADFDHGSVSIACQFTRRTVLLGLVRAISDTRRRRCGQIPRLLQAQEEDR